MALWKTSGSYRHRRARRTQRVDVGPVIDHHPLGQRLFGAHVTQRAHQVAGLRQPRVALHLGQTEVAESGQADQVASTSRFAGLTQPRTTADQSCGPAAPGGRCHASVGHAAEVGRIARRALAGEAGQRRLGA